MYPAVFFIVGCGPSEQGLNPRRLSRFTADLRLKRQGKLSILQRPEKLVRKQSILRDPVP